MVENKGRPKGSKNRKPQPRIDRAGDAARLTPLEYEVSVWVGRGADAREIASRLDLPEEKVEWLIESAMRQKNCRNLADLEAMFEPDWARIDTPPESRWEKAGNRWVLRGGDREKARTAYAERRERYWKKFLRKS
jgi:DNA-binding CsgD family transcriptional regulator